MTTKIFIVYTTSGNEYELCPSIYSIPAKDETDARNKFNVYREMNKLDETITSVCELNINEIDVLLEYSVE
jgi:hypothetical protein